MWVNNVRISNFRNLKELELSIGKNSLLVVGENSQGKTAIIEAIYFTSFLKSFRTSCREDVISFESNSMFIMTTIGKKDSTSRYNILFERGKKLAVKGSEGVEKKQNMFSIIKVVMFYPGITEIISGFPERRRSFIDSVISKCEPSFVFVLRKYKQCLRERNIILSKNDKSSLNELSEIWEERLSKYGSIIEEKRINYLKKIEELLPECYSEIFGRESDVAICYRGFFRDENIVDRESLQEILKKELAVKRKNDVFRGYTSCGPHRDEISFISGGKDFRYFASRGEQRALVLSLLEIEIELIKRKTEEYPVFLVDDIFSEFDQKREKNFLLSTRKKDIQIIATAINLTEENKKLFGGAVTKITGGRCTSM